MGRKARRRIIRHLLFVVILAIAAWILYTKQPAINALPNAQKLQEIKEATNLLIEDIQDALSTPDEAANPCLYGPYAVVRVVDGDTAIINIEGEEKRVRFIGIDTPESVNPDETKNTEEGKIASQYTKDLLTGQNVYLEYDVTAEDDYGRTLAYVYLDDGITMVEDLILMNGMATTLTIQPNIKYADHFYALQVEAREAGIGFWETEFFRER